VVGDDGSIVATNYIVGYSVLVYETTFTATVVAVDGISSPSDLAILPLKDQEIRIGDKLVVIKGGDISA